MPETLRDQIAHLLEQYGRKRVVKVLEHLLASPPRARGISKRTRSATIPKDRPPDRPGVKQLLALHRDGRFLRDQREYRQFLSETQGITDRSPRRSVARLRSALEGLSDQQLAALITDAQTRASPFDAIVRSVVGEPRIRNSDAIPTRTPSKLLGSDS